MSARALLVLLFTLLVCGSRQASADGANALGAGGELYQARAGRYGELFPGGRQAAPDSPVLALDVQLGNASERLLVPESAGPDPDIDPVLLYDESTAAVFVVWQTKISGVFPIFNLARLKDKTWSPAIEITGNPYALKSPAQLLVSRDDGTRGGEDTIALHQRMVIHVVWAEENHSGTYNAYYSPIIFEDGSYLGRNKVYRLRALDGSPVAAAEVGLAVLKAPRLQPGADGSSVVVAFTDAESGRLAVAEIRLLPRELGMIGDEARAHIFGGAEHFPNDLESLADSARAHIFGGRHGYKQQVARALADELRDFIVAWRAANGDLGALADAARAHLVQLGATFSGGGLDSVVVATGSQAPAIDEIAANAGPNHLLQLRIASSRPAPRVGTETVALFASADGEEVIAAWAFPQRVRYRESTATGWSEPREIRLSAELKLESAWKILADRARSR